MLAINTEQDKKIKFKTFFWKDTTAENFHLGKLVVQTGAHPIKFRDIYYKDQTELFFPVITFISSKASRIKMGSHGYGVTLLFTPETISNTKPDKSESEKQSERQEKQKEIDEFIEWYNSVHRRLMILNAIEDEKDSNKKGKEVIYLDKTMEEIENNKILMSFILSGKRDYHIRVFPNDDNKDPCPIMYLPLNSADPFVRDYKKRTNFIRLDGKSTFPVQEEIVNRMMKLCSEIVPSVRFHRITSNGGIQFRFLNATPLGYFTPTAKVFSKQVLDKYSSYETIKNFNESEEATKDALNSEEGEEKDEDRSGFENSNDDGGDSNEFGNNIDLVSQKPIEEFTFKKKYNNPNSKKSN